MRARLPRREEEADAERDVERAEVASGVHRAGRRRTRAPARGSRSRSAPARSRPGSSAARALVSSAGSARRCSSPMAARIPGVRSGMAGAGDSRSRRWRSSDVVREAAAVGAPGEVARRPWPRRDRGPRRRGGPRCAWRICSAGHTRVVDSGGSGSSPVSSVAVDELTRLFLAARDGDRTALLHAIRASQADVWRLAPPPRRSRTTPTTSPRTRSSARGGRSRTFRGDSSARTWLLVDRPARVRRRGAAVDAPATARRPGRAAVAAAPGGGTTADPGDAHAVAALVDELDRDQRAAFVLTQMVGCSYEEAAEVCGVPVGTIRSRVARARERPGRRRCAPPRPDDATRGASAARARASSARLVGGSWSSPRHPRPAHGVGGLTPTNYETGCSSGDAAASPGVDGDGRRPRRRQVELDQHRPPRRGGARLRRRAVPARRPAAACSRTALAGDVPQPVDASLTTKPPKSADSPAPPEWRRVSSGTTATLARPPRALHGRPTIPPAVAARPRHAGGSSTSSTIPMRVGDRTVAASGADRLRARRRRRGRGSSARSCSRSRCSCSARTRRVAHGVRRSGSALLTVSRARARDRALGRDAPRRPAPSWARASYSLVGDRARAARARLDVAARASTRRCRWCSSPRSSCSSPAASPTSRRSGTRRSRARSRRAIARLLVSARPSGSAPGLAVAAALPAPAIVPRPRHAPRRPKAGSVASPVELGAPFVVVGLHLDGRVRDLVRRAGATRAWSSTPCASVPAPIITCALATSISEVSVHTWRSCTSTTPGSASSSARIASRSTCAGATWSSTRSARGREPPRARQDPHADHRGDDRVDGIPARGRDDDRGDDHADRPGGVGHRVDVGAAHREAVLRAVAQHEEHDQVDREPERRRRRASAPLRRRSRRATSRIAASTSTYPATANSEERVHERRQDLEPEQPEGARRRRCDARLATTIDAEREGDGDRRR